MCLKRRMLCMSVHGENSNFYLRIELDEYYRKRDRAVFSEQKLNTFDPKILLNDELFYQKTIDYIITNINVLIQMHKDEIKSREMLIYPFFRNDKDVLRVDEEDYKYVKTRKHCADVYIEMNKINNLNECIEFQSSIAQAICKHLPLGPFPHVMDDNAPDALVDLDLMKPQFYDGWME